MIQIQNILRLSAKEAEEGKGRPVRSEPLHGEFAPKLPSWWNKSKWSTKPLYEMIKEMQSETAR